MADKEQKNKTKFALPSRALQQKAALQQKEIVNSTFDTSTRKEADNNDDNKNLINSPEVVENKTFENSPEELNSNKNVLEEDPENTVPIGDTSSLNLVQVKELSQASESKEVPLNNSGNQTRPNPIEEKKKRGRKKGIKNGANDDKEKVDKFLKLEKYPHQIATVMAGLEGITIPSIVGKAVEQYAATNHPELLKLIKKMNKA